VVGGFLIAASTVGTFAAYTAATTPPAGAYLVVTADLDAGERLAADDLALVALDLPPDQHRLAFTDPAVLDGATALAPLAAGQLLQVSDVAKPAGGPERAQISLSLDPGSALGGDPGLLGPGDRVAVIATYTQAGAPETATVSPDAEVVRVLGAGERTGAGGLTVVLAVPPGDLEPLAQAAAAGVVTLARTTGLTGAAVPG
jgi:Flp pilus assembly protein CpaB